MILVVSLASIVSGGGFYLGILRGVVGGILAIVFEPSEDEEVAFDLAGLGAPMPSAEGGPPRPTRSGVCANCRLSLPIGATRCPSGETSVPVTARAPAAT